MPAISVQTSGKIIKYELGKTLLEILLEEKCFVDNPCNGKGICGKCRVRIVSGNVEEASTTERKVLSDAELKKGIRLACFIKPTEDLEVEILQKEERHEVFTSGYVPEFEFDTGIKKQLIEIRKPSLSSQTSYEEQMKVQTGVKEIDFAVLRSASFNPGITTVVIHDNEAVTVESGDTTDKLYGVAIDIGTTTVVCALINMMTGEEIANASMLNAQKHFGMDVLTRITYEMEHKDTGVDDLQIAIVDSINAMIEECCKKTGIAREHIYEISVAANCTMMHTLLGVDAVSIGRAPYAPIFTGAKNIKASEIGIKAAEGARLYCLPSASSYVGADIVAGAYVCDLKKQKGNVLFIDIGTNGEIVLLKDGELFCCSCAAGPAFEGMNINCGMCAAEGAIEDMEITENGIKFKVIGEQEPIGICGSGILAAVKELLRVGIVRKDGAFIKKNELNESDYRYSMIQMNECKREFIMLDEKRQLLISQGDIRQVQLGKGAILSGFITLLTKAGITMADLDKVMIAGQFGAHLPTDSLTGTGILPKEVKDKLVYVGNTSKTGAYMALMSKKAKFEMEELASHMDYMELGATDNYERVFCECLIFPKV